MAKKNEFKPDKTGSGFLSKLYLTQKQRKSLLKWTLYLLVLLVLSVLQDVLFSRLRVNGATTDLVPCAIFLICILEGSQNGCIFALVSSLLYLLSGTAPGVYCVVLLTFLAVGACVFRQAFLQKGFGTTMLCTVMATMLYELAVFAIGLLLGLTYPSRIAGFLITGALSLIAAPLLYPILRSIGTIGGETWKE